MHEAKSRLSELVELARQGQQVVIARAGVPVAVIVPHREAPKRRTGGRWRDRAHIGFDFDTPMPEIEELLGS